MKKRLISILMHVSAGLMGAGGLLMLFAAQEMAAALGGESHLVVALWGAALIGFGAMNWTARSLPLGGIYGRAVVAGNQAHSFVGAMVLLNAAYTHAGNAPVVALLVLYLILAAAFSYLLFRASGLDT
ncbi:MAG: hypothetical protein R2834_15465 [Rhodothermales bacterium]